MSYSRERDVYTASLRDIEDRMDHAENMKRLAKQRRPYFEAAVWVILFLLIAVAELMFG